MLDFIKWLLTPLWVKRYLQEPETDTEDTIETTTLIDSDDNVVITEKIDTTPVDELWKECDDIVSNMMWDATDNVCDCGCDSVCHMNLDEFIEDLNKNAEMSMKQRDQMKNYVIDELNTSVIKSPKKKKKRKKKRKLRYNLRNRE